MYISQSISRGLNVYVCYCDENLRCDPQSYPFLSMKGQSEQEIRASFCSEFQQIATFLCKFLVCHCLFLNYQVATLFTDPHSLNSSLVNSGNARLKLTGSDGYRSAITPVRPGTKSLEVPIHELPNIYYTHSLSLSYDNACPSKFPCSAAIGPTSFPNTAVVILDCSSVAVRSCQPWQFSVVDFTINQARVSDCGSIKKVAI